MRSFRLTHHADTATMAQARMAVANAPATLADAMT
jgi:hypothetical protein